MKRFPLDLTKQKHTILKMAAAEHETKMNLLVEKAIAQTLWSEYGILWPGYIPDHCHFCPRPMADHAHILANGYEPESYECPGDDEVGF